MHQYPKVYRWDSSEVPDEFWTGEGIITEKVDGSNFRFILYEDRFREHYSEEILSVNPTDGDIIFGTKNPVRGRISDDINSFEGAFHRSIKTVRNDVNTEAIRSIHDDFGPVVFFCEAMIYHMLDYGYTSNPPPSLVGFDVYAINQDNREDIPEFSHSFEGFLETKKALEFHSKIGIEPVEEPEDVKEVSLEELDVSKDIIPQSKFGDILAEGVVIRSKGFDKCRVKFVREEVREVNKDLFGPSEHNYSSPEERFLAMFCQQPRILKTANKMVLEEDYTYSKDIIDDLWRRVYRDIWAEEWNEIKDVGFSFTPADVKPILARQCANVIERQLVNADLNNCDPSLVWNR